MKKEQGLISLLMMFLILPIVILAMVCVDATRVIYAKQTVRIANEVALENLLSHYNADLKKIYGLFAAENKTDIQQEVLSYYLQSIRGSLSLTQTKALTDDLMQSTQISTQQWDAQTIRKSSGSMTNLNGVYILQRPEFLPVVHSTLYEPTILKYQIVDYMKYRGLMSMSEHLLKKVGVLKGQQTVAKTQITQMKNDQSELEGLKQLYQLQPILNKVKESSLQGALRNFSSSQELIDQLNQLVDIRQSIGQGIEAISVYFDDLMRLEKQIDTVKLANHIIVTQLKEAVEKEKNSLKKQRAILEQVEVKDDSSGDLNNTTGHQKFKQVASIQKHETVELRDLNKQVVFVQLTMPIQQTSSLSVIQSIKSTYEQSKSNVVLENVLVPGELNTQISEEEWTLPTNDNVFTQTIDRLQNSLKFLQNTHSISDTMTNIINELLVSEYASEMFSNYLDRPKVQTPITKQTLLNGIPLTTIHSPTRGAEVEYLLFGKSSAIANVQEALKCIKLIRFVFNLAFTYTNSQLRTMIFSSSLIAGPFAKGLDTLLHVLIALAETQMDENLLLKGRTVAVVKTAATFKMQPTQLVNGLLEFAQDQILQKLNDGVDNFTEKINNWFEGNILQVEQKVNEMVDTFMQQQQESVSNLITQQVEAVLQPLMSSQINALEQGDEKLTKKIQEGFEKVQDQIIARLNNTLVSDALKNVLLVAEESIKDLKKEYVDMVKRIIVTQEKVITNQLNTIVTRYVTRLVQPVRNAVSNLAQHYRQEVLAIVRSQVEQISSEAKERLNSLTMTFFNQATEQLKTNSYAQVGNVFGLNYSEYLKIFILFELISNPQTPLYHRMAQLIEQNLSLDLTQFHTVFQANSMYKVDTFFLDWFKHDYQLNNVLGY